MLLHVLVAESEPAKDRNERRKSVGRSSGETYIDTLKSIDSTIICDRVKPGDRQAELPSGEALSAYDAVFMTGSPLHLYQDTPETRREVEFMRSVFTAGVPAFGSCAGLQVAVVAAEGTVRPSLKGREAGFARRIVPTEAGRLHPLLQGRASSFDAPSFHSDEVETLPQGAVILASNAVTEVQAVEIRSGRGLFWGVQYHPELDLYEVAGALRRQSDDIINDGLAKSQADVEAYAEIIEALHNEPDRSDLSWYLGVDEQVTDVNLRQTELRNFLRFIREQPR